MPLYAPWAWLQWAFMVAMGPVKRIQYDPRMYRALWAGAFVFVGGAFVAVVGMLMVELAGGKRKDAVAETVDSAHFADAAELLHEGFFRSAGPIIGAFERKPGELAPLRYDGQAGVEHVASPGDDKTSQLKASMLTPLQRDYAERVSAYGDTTDGRRADFWGEEPSIVALDVKGGLVASTSVYQHSKLGKDVFIVEPLAESTDGRASFNPFWSIRVGTIFEAGDCYQAAVDLTPPNGTQIGASASYWDAACTAFGSAVIGTLAYRALRDGKYTTLSLPSLVAYISSHKASPAVYGNDGSLLRPAMDAIEVLAADMRKPHDPHGLFGWQDEAGQPTSTRAWIVSAALAMESKQAEERSGVYGTFLERLGVFRDEVLRQHISTSSFSFKALANRPKPGIVYLNIPAMKLNHYRIFISIFVRTAIRDLTESTGDINGQEVRGNLRSTLLVLDEIATLGRDPELATASGYLRGHGVMVMALWQSEQQKLQHYGDHESLTATMAAHIFGRPERPTDAELLSKAIGQFSTLLKKRSHARGRGPGSTTDSNDIATRSLLTPSEVKRLPRDENIVFSRGLTIKAKKYPYYKNESLVKYAEMGAVTASDVMTLTPFFVENLKRLFGEDIAARLAAPVPAKNGKPQPKPEPTRVVVPLTGGPFDAIRAAMQGAQLTLGEEVE